jgi:hypothetical protein
MNGTRDTPQNVTTHDVGDKKTAVVERATVNLIREVAMDIDKQRITAVRTLQALRYVFQRGEWIAASAASDPAMPVIPVIPEADAMHGLLMRRTDVLAGCTESSENEAELKTTVDCLEAYEAKRWPLGKEPGGKG